MISTHTSLCQGLNVSYQVYRLTVATLPGAIFFIMTAIYIFLAFLFLVNLLLLFIPAASLHSTKVIGSRSPIIVATTALRPSFKVSTTSSTTLKATRWRSLMNTLTLLMTTLLLTSYAKVSSQHISDCILTALKKGFEIQVPKP